jgi:diguanylate cyclase (GGDEF)-like protein
MCCNAGYLRIGAGYLLGHQVGSFTATGLLALMAPMRSVLFGVVFFCLWCWWKRLRYLLYLGASFTLFAVGTMTQTLGIPHEIGCNFMVSAVAYTAALIALLDACRKRMDLKPKYGVRLCIAAGVLLGIAYFCFVSPDLTARVYVMNFGLGALTLVEAVSLGRAADSTMDRLVYWVILGLGIQGFPRTLLSFGTTGASRDVMAFAHSSYWKWMNATYAILVVVVGATMVAAIVADVMEELHGRAMEDPLTGLLNRRGFEDSVRRQVAKAKGRCLTIAVCDVDSFKTINDSYGHVEGDAVLKRIAELLRENLRRSDEASRFGGEEFVMLLTDVDRDDALVLIERLRSAIEATRFGGEKLRRRRITASFGVAEYQAGEDLEQAIRRADRMLYAAKRNGRNQALVDWLHIEGGPGLLDAAVQWLN